MHVSSCPIFCCTIRDSLTPTAVSCRCFFLFFFQYSTSGWRHFSCHFPPLLQCNSFFLSPPFFPQRLQYVAGWIVCYYPAGDNIITTYLLSRVCKEWCCLGPQWSNSLTQGSRITHSWLGEVKHYQLERGVNKREVKHPPTRHHTQTKTTPLSSR